LYKCILKERVNRHPYGRLRIDAEDAEKKGEVQVGMIEAAYRDRIYLAVNPEAPF
jgi:hypothetical protein